MGTDKTPQIEHGQLVIVGSKGSGKSSLYQCLKSPNPQVADGLNCSVLVEDWQPFSTESPGKFVWLVFKEPNCYKSIFLFKYIHSIWGFIYHVFTRHFFLIQLQMSVESILKRTCLKKIWMPV